MMKPHVVRPDDGSTLIEWVGSNKRFGLSLEKGASPSWYFVDKDGSTEGDDLPLPVLEALADYFLTPSGTR